MQKLRVGILGATGMVGQRFIQLLENHPQFEISALAASDRSQGKRYEEACSWRLAGEMPQRCVRSLVVQPPAPPLDCDLVFSSLPGDVAREAEGSFARAGYPVISNSSAFRMDEDVPLLIPEVNHEHLKLLAAQRERFGSGGFIVTNPNCSTIMIALALAPLHARFGVSAVVATTMQALSGAGYPGVASLDITDNVLPFIGGEEEKIESETRKILGRAAGDRIEAARMKVSAQCNRVNVTDGHMAAVSVKLNKSAELDAVREALRSFSSLPQELGLYSAPERPIIVRDERDRPQPRLDRDAGNGMSVTIGSLKPDTVLDYRFVALSHNTIRGAAGAAILNAELLIAPEARLQNRTRGISPMKRNTVFALAAMVVLALSLVLLPASSAQRSAKDNSRKARVAKTAALESDLFKPSGQPQLKAQPVVREAVSFAESAAVRDMPRVKAKGPKHTPPDRELADEKGDKGEVGENNEENREIIRKIDPNAPGTPDAAIAHVNDPRRTRRW